MAGELGMSIGCVQASLDRFLPLSPRAYLALWIAATGPVSPGGALA